MLLVRMIVILACTAGLGCIEPTALVRCGDLACPTTTVCLVDRCVSSSQLASCTDKAEGDACAVGDRVGACSGGACTFIGCGNGIVDPGEVCDDANTSFGDGCGAACDSLETCGNGLVDFAIGEACDCGSDASTQPAQCASVNSDATAAECTQGCQLRYCGDGELNVLEQCDDTLLGDATCADFGYYHGTPSCSTGCVLAVDGCAGRCGDLDVEPAFGEFCDGAPPAGSCLTYGYDAGYVDCSTACTPDAARCEKFGWTQLETYSVLDLYATASAALIVSAEVVSDRTAWMALNGLRVPAPAGVYRVATGDGPRAYAIGPTQIAVWSGSSWTALQPGWSSTTVDPLDAWATAAGLYVAIGGTVWRYAAGTWTDQALTGIVALGGSSTEVFAWSPSAVWSSSGDVWAAEVLPSGATGVIRAFARGKSGPSWVAIGSALYRRDASIWAQDNWVYGTVKSAFASDAGDLVVVTVTGTVARVIAATNAQKPLGAPSAAAVIHVAPDGGVASGGTTGAYQIRTGRWGFLDFILAGYAYDPYENDHFESFTVSGAENVAVLGPGGSNFAVWFGTLGSNVEPIDNVGYSARDAAVASDGLPVFAIDGAITDAYGNWLWDPSIFDANGNYIGQYNVGMLEGTRSGRVLAGGTDVIVVGTDSTTWTVIDVAGYDVYALGESDAGDIAALATTGSGYALLRVDAGGAVTVLSTTRLLDLWVGPDGAIAAVGLSSVVRCPQDVCTQETVPALLYRIGATSLEDVFVVGSSSAANFGELTHWDGTRWTPVRIPQGGISDLHVNDEMIAYLRSYGTGIHTLTRVVKW